MFSLLPLAAALLVVAAPAAAKEITVLGLPLGGKLTVPVSKCKDAPPKRDAGICWVYSRKWPGGVSGGIHLPDDSSRPTWAAYAMFEASIAKDGTLTEFTVESSDSHSFKTIVDSISARFGRPSLPAPPPSYMGFASWGNSEIEITTFCKIIGPCYTKFVSAKITSDNRRRIQGVAQRDAARPIAP